MPSTPPRGSAEQVNEVFRIAVERGKVIVDNLVKIIAASGYPPMTVPITLKDLKAMSEQDAVAYLQNELQRTMVADPVTGDKKPDKQTVELALSYAEWKRGL